MNKREKKLLKEVDWNDGYYLEGLDRCHTIMVMIQEILEEHPSILKSGLSKEVEKLLDDTMHVYHKISHTEIENEKMAKKQT